MWMVLLTFALNLVGANSNQQLHFSFGSCNKPWRDQEIFNTISKDHPQQTFIWMGDATYVTPRDLQSLREAWQYPALTDPTSPYQKMKKSLLNPPIGVYDDHDLGVNDCGGTLPNKEERKQLYLDFLETPKDSPLRVQDGGIFNSHVFKSGNRSIKFILLDTRYERSDYVIPFLPWLPLFSGITRVLGGITGLTFYQDSSRHLLSPVQWNFLESQLLNNSSDINVIISSVQVFTSFPMFESWGHFPSQRLKLLNLLKKFESQNPKSSFILLSGDVHFSEKFSLSKDLGVIEVTSSGLTHGCTDFLPAAVCNFLVSNFGALRTIATEESASFFVGKNYGMVSVDFENEKFFVRVKDVEGKDRLVTERRIGSHVVPDDFESLPGIVPSITKRLLLAGGCIASLFLFKLTSRCWPPKRMIKTKEK